VAVRTDYGGIGSMLQKQGGKQKEGIYKNFSDMLQAHNRDEKVPVACSERFCRYK
jgi:hypothetical protein